MMTIITANGLILWANQKLLTWLGYEPHEYIGHIVWEVRNIFAEFVMNLVG
jgi:PAS domain-containing protein